MLKENFELKVGLLQLVTSSQFHGFERDDPHAHIRWFNKITSTLKYKNVPHDAIKLMLFPFYLEGAARILLEKEPPRSILTWEDLVSNEAWDQFKELLRKCPRHSFLEFHQIDTFYNALTQSDQDSSNAAAGVSTTTSSSSHSPNVTALTKMVKELVLMNKANQQASVKAVDEICVTYGGPHPYYECLATDSNTFNAYAPTGPTIKEQNPSGSGLLLSNTVANPRGDVKAITTRSGVAYDGPTIPPTPSPLSKEVERDTEATKDKRLNDQKLYEKANNQMLKFLQSFQILHFDISFADVLLHMLKFASTFKSLLSNKEKLFELASIPLNENFSAVLLKKLPKKLGDPGKFLIPCDFPELDECLASADLGASINLMPLSIWKKLSLPKLTLTRMALELANRSVAYPNGVAEDVFVKVRKFHFPADFVVVDYDVDHRVPLILGRPFLRTTRTLIDVHGDELTLRVNDEAITFKFGHTSRYSRNYYDETVHQVDVIDIACKEYAQEEKCHFMVKEGSVLGHKISKSEIEVDRAKVDVIAKLPHPTTVKGVKSFLGHAGFYRRFIQDFSKLSRPMTHLLEKESPFDLSKEYVEAFNALKKKLTEAPILVAPDWDLLFEIMCDVSDFAVGAVLGQRKTKHFQRYTMQVRL
ncbi:reverse transcriptase domain-containing protein [Tanacetum coccineum]